MQQNYLGSVVPPNCHERSKQIPADDRVYFLAQFETMQTDQRNFWKYHSSKITVQMSHRCLWHKRKTKKHMHVLYTNHMYPSSVVSNVNVKRKHPSWCLYTKHKNIFKKNNSIFHCHFIRLLFAQCAWCHRLSPTGAYGYIHVCAQYLIKVNATTPECNAWKMVKDLDWTNFHVLFDSGLSHLISQCSSIWNKNYRQINKTIPNIIPATFQTNTRTGPHLPCDTCRCHTRWGSYSWVQLIFGLKGIQVRD